MTITLRNGTIILMAECELCGQVRQCSRVTDPSDTVWTLCEECNPENEAVAHAECQHIDFIENQDGDRVCTTCGLQFIANPGVMDCEFCGQCFCICEDSNHAPVGVGQCPVCKHFGKDCTGTKQTA